MAIWKDKQGMQPGWMPERLIYRGELRTPGEVGKMLLHPSEGPWDVRSTPRRCEVVGPRGAGTSTIARCLLGAISHGYRPLAAGGPLRVLRIDARNCAGAHEAMVRCFQAFDSEFSGHGFSAGRLATLLRRRLAAEGGPRALWFDDFPRTPDPDTAWELLVSLLGQTQAGPQGAPSPYLIFSGECSPGTETGSGNDPAVLRISLSAVSPDLMMPTLTAMSRSAFLLPPAPEVLLRLGDLLLAQGWGLSVGARALRMAGERAESRGSATVHLIDLPDRITGPRLKDGVLLDEFILAGLRSTSGAQDRRTLWEYLSNRLRSAGKGLPSASQVRRHLKKLEEQGLIERRLRLGGLGGSQSRYRLVSALTFPVTGGTGAAPSVGRVPVGSGVSLARGSPAPGLPSPAHAPPQPPMPV